MGIVQASPIADSPFLPSLIGHSEIAAFVHNLDDAQVREGIPEHDTTAWAGRLPAWISHEGLARTDLGSHQAISTTPASKIRFVLWMRIFGLLAAKSFVSSRCSKFQTN